MGSDLDKETQNKKPSEIYGGECIEDNDITDRFDLKLQFIDGGKAS